MKKARLFSVFLLAMFVSVYVNAQELSVGADFVSRYIWRGLEAGDNLPAIQPSIELGYEGFVAGIWGSSPISTVASIGSEIDFYLGYSYAIENGGDVSLTATDYYFTDAGNKFSSFDTDGSGAHTVELALGYSGPETLPVSLILAVNVHNDEDNSLYAQIGYSIPIKDVTLDLFAGMTPGGEDVEYYGTQNFSVINLGLTASKEIKVTEDFSIPVFGTWVYNPDQEISYFAFGVSL